MKGHRALKFAAALIAMAPMLAKADGARDWLNAPINMNFLYAYYTYSNSETSINSNLPVDGAEVSAHVPILRYARTFDLGGRVGGVQFVVPYAFIDAELVGTNRNRSINGASDITAIFLGNLYGAPALTPQEFAAWTPESYLTAAISVTAPTGSYHSDRLINPGKNRWAFKPQLAWGKPTRPGEWLSINGAVEFYGKNDSYFRERTQKQSELFVVDMHYSKNLNPAVWVAVDAIYSHGGEVRIDGTHQDNEQRTLRLGLSGSMNFSATDAVSAGVTRTAMKEKHTPSATNLQISYSRIW